MPINHKYKILFIHIPKCGGTSIEKFFDMMDRKLLYYDLNAFKFDGVDFAMQHLTPKYLKQHEISSEIYHSYTKFTIVRNPYRRVVSEYMWRHKSKKNKTEPDFYKWMRNYYKTIDNDHKLKQVDFIYDENGNKEVDYIMRLENITTEFPKFLDFISYKEEKKLQIINSTKSDEYKYLLSDRCKEFIYDFYEEDFKMLNYKK